MSALTVLFEKFDGQKKRMAWVNTTLWMSLSYLWALICMKGFVASYLGLKTGSNFRGLPESTVNCWCSFFFVVGQNRVFVALNSSWTPADCVVRIYVEVPCIFLACLQACSWILSASVPIVFRLPRTMPEQYDQRAPFSDICDLLSFSIPFSLYLMLESFP
jgi:hypothetical protein